MADKKNDKKGDDEEPAVCIESQSDSIQIDRSIDDDAKYFRDVNPHSFMPWDELELKDHGLLDAKCRHSIIPQDDIELRRTGLIDDHGQLLHRSFPRHYPFDELALKQSGYVDSHCRHRTVLDFEKDQRGNFEGPHVQINSPPASSPPDISRKFVDKTKHILGGKMHKAIIKQKEMSDEHLGIVISITEDAENKCQDEREIASNVKKGLESQIGGAWQVVVGRTFGSSIHHEDNFFAYVFVGRMHIQSYQEDDDLQTKLVDRNKDKTLMGQKSILVPSCPELTQLIKQQEQIIEELDQQLNLFKKHVLCLRENTISRDQQNELVLEELKAQFVKSNLATFSKNEDKDQTSAPSDKKNFNSDKFSVYNTIRKECENCRQLKTEIEVAAKSLKELEDKNKMLKTECADMKTKERDYVNKVFESAQLAEQAITDKTEINVQLSVAQNRSIQSSNEIRSLLEEHQKSLQQCAENASLRYKAELENLHNQVKIRSNNEKTLMEQNKRLGEENAVIEKELGATRAKLEIVAHSTKTKITDVETSLRTILKQKEYAEKELTVLQKNCNTEREQKFETMTELEHGNAELKIQNKNLQMSLNDKIKDICNQKQSVLNLQSELNRAKQQNSKLLEETNLLSLNSKAELKERVRIMELAHGKAELEQLIWKQNGIISNLREECKFLNDKMKRLCQDHKYDLRNPVLGGGGGGVPQNTSFLKR